METKARGGPATRAGAEEIEIAKRAKRIRLALIAAGVLAVVGFGLAIYFAVKEESNRERWDVMSQLRTEMEPQQDPFWANPHGVYNDERERYVKALETFLDKEASKTDDALTPHTRFLIAKTLADHILSNPGLIDSERRAEFYAKGVAQLEAIRDDHPDFPLNWSKLGEGGFASLTRQFIDWYHQNQQWEQEHLLQTRAPDAGVRVLFRTDRGDLLMGLYGEDAPSWTKAFLDRVKRGHYDGTAFVMKEEIGDAAEPEQHYVMAGGEATRDLTANFDAAATKKTSDVESRSAELPEESRNRLAHVRGIVSAWHASGDEYDNPERFLCVVRRSPQLDYEYSPVGMLVNENGIDSLATLDRIFGGAVWREDRDVRNGEDYKDILSWLQAPVRIVKALVYEDGALQWPAVGGHPSRADVDASEKSLSSVKADQYKTEPPARPADPEKDDGKDKGDEPSGDDEGAPAKDDGDK